MYRNINPFTLSLIPILPVYGMDPQAAEKVDGVKKVVERVSAAV
ncbi:MAG: hypothetical protein ACOY30_10485 [Bacillota bacterium]